MQEKTLKVLDGFRAVAILLVVNFHFEVYVKQLPWFNVVTGAGWIGVLVFFVLSSFLLIRPYVYNGLNDRSLPSLTSFFRNRLIRISPLFIISSFIIVSVKLAIGKFTGNLTDIFYHFLFLNNFREGASPINPVLWSLAVEMQFYLICPVIGFVVHDFLRKKKYTMLFVFLIFLILLSIGYKFYTTQIQMSYTSQLYPLLVYNSPLANLEVFVYGIIGSIIYTLYLNSKVLPSYLTYGVYIACVVIAYLIMRYLFLVTGYILDKSVWNCFMYSTLSIIIVLVVLTTLVEKKSWWYRLMESEGMVFISKISYSLYIWHLVVFDVVRYFVRSLLEGLSPFFQNTITLIVSILFAFLISIVSYQLIEKPFLKFKTKTNNL